MQQQNAFWNRIATLYDPVMRRDKSLYNQILRHTSAFLKPTDKVLEVAAGTGLLSLALAPTVSQIEACDLSAPMIRISREKAASQKAVNVRFTVQNAYNLSFASNSFDAVLIANGLHIMPSPAKALAEARRVMRPDGLLIAPTFLHRENDLIGLLQTGIMSLAGFTTHYKWNDQSFLLYLKRNDFTIVDAVLIKGHMPLAFVVARPK